MVSETFKKLAQRLFNRFGIDIRHYYGDFPDLSAADIEMIRSVQPYTMTSVERLYNLLEATRFITKHGVRGAIVECGVWRGGSMMLVARCLLEQEITDRDLYLFDTFEGMSAPTADDVMNTGLQARAMFRRHARPGGGSDWCSASLPEVEKNIGAVGYPPSRIACVKGKVEDTLPANAPEEIALLRLDTDFYASTKHELAHLYPRLAPGGVLIIDDYGSWLGCRKAVDEYIREQGLRLLLVRVDNSCRVVVKP